MKPVVAILAGHHGRGTGASYRERDEWALARADALELYLQLSRDGLTHPILEPIAADDNPGEIEPLVRSALWALSNKASAAIELHYNSFETTKPSGHCVVSNRMSSLVEHMARALDTLPNKRRETIINAGFKLPRLLEPIPCVIVEPAFIFEDLLRDQSFAAMLLAALKRGVYSYYSLEVNND